MKEYTLDDHLKELCKDPEFKKGYEFELQKYEIVKKILWYRIKHKLSQGQLAKVVGVSQQHISKIENADFTSMETLDKVLNAIGYTVKIQAVPLRSINTVKKPYTYTDPATVSEPRTPYNRKRKK